MDGEQEFDIDRYLDALIEVPECQFEPKEDYRWCSEGEHWQDKKAFKYSTCCVPCFKKRKKEYDKNRQQSKSGFISERRRLYYKINKENVDARNIKYYRQNRDDILEYKRSWNQKNWAKNGDKLRQLALERYHNNKGYYRVHAAKERARKKGIPFTLDVEHWTDKVNNATHCEFSGLPFLEDDKYRRSPFGRSLDQVILPMGYTDANTKIVCNMANLAKSEWTTDDLLLFCKAVVLHNKLLRLEPQEHKVLDRPYFDNGQ